VRILVVEDDSDLNRKLRQALVQAGYAVDSSADGVEAEYLGDEGTYEAVILDLGLPGRRGLDVLRNWRARGNSVPVIILTSRDAWHEKVDGFKAGADDYVAKPFHMEELIARLQAVVRRGHGQAGGTIQTHDLTLDEERQQVTQGGGEAIDLTGTEFRLLRYFMLHPGSILSKTVLAENVYDFDSDKDSNVIEVYVNRLRHKLGKEIIRTRRGQGYVFGEPDK
jgi:two-component system OmpR family response regulator